MTPLTSLTWSDMLRPSFVLPVLCIALTTAIVVTATVLLTRAISCPGVAP